MNHSILLAGFGGQGILFAGKFLTYIGMLSGHEVSWLPSYGPEMRGGTANCGVVISETQIGSPIVLRPDILVALNLPSYDKFEPVVKSFAFVDTSLVDREPLRTDITTFGLAATRTAEDKDLKGFANIIMTGKLIKELKLCSFDLAVSALTKTVPPRKTELMEKNVEALKLGMSM